LDLVLDAPDLPFLRGKAMLITGMIGDRNAPEGMIYVLRKIYWDFFITVPLPHQRGMETRANHIWHAFRGKLAEHFDVRRDRMIWVCTLEYGPSGTNPHLHALISGEPRNVTLEKFTNACIECARRMKIPKKVDVQIYDEERDVIPYIFKERLNPSDGTCWPILSPNCWPVIRRNRQM